MPTLLRILCWGCGVYAAQALKSIEGLGYQIEGFIDTNYKHNTFYGYPVLEMGDALERISSVDFLGIMSVLYLDDIYKCAIAKGIPPEKIKVFLNERKEFGSIKDAYSDKVYSQYGEECYLKNTFSKQKKGLYVDVGAHHPYRFSNTYWAYRLGWKGINIEPNKNNFELFRLERRDDINLNCGIWDCCGKMRYYQFVDPALNTFSDEMADHYSKRGFPVESITEVSVRKLQDILEEYGIQHVNFLNIDVEGAEMHVLNSIDFSAVKIDYIVLEQFTSAGIGTLMESDEYSFLVKRGYCLVSFYGITAIYKLMR